MDIKKHVACVIWGGPQCEPATSIHNLGVRNYPFPVSEFSLPKRKIHGLRSVEVALQEEAEARKLIPPGIDAVAPTPQQS